MVTYTPEQPITHEIEVTFNGEQVPGSPYLCRVIDPSNTIREIPVQVKRSYKIFDLSKGGESSEDIFNLAPSSKNIFTLG